jgi:hypothetical protein
MQLNLGSTRLRYPGRNWAWKYFRIWVFPLPHLAPTVIAAASRESFRFKYCSHTARAILFCSLTGTPGCPVLDLTRPKD